MIAASTAAAFLRSASPAAFPSNTTSTFSPTPAPTESIASIVVPRGLSSSVSGCTSISFAPSSLRFFCVATTVPTTRQICMSDVRWSMSELFGVHPIDDADNRSVGWRLGRIEGKRGFAAAHEEYALANAGADRVQRDERLPHRITRHGERLQHEQFHTDEIRVFDRRYDFAHDTRHLHSPRASRL